MRINTLLRNFSCKTCTVFSLAQSILPLNLFLFRTVIRLHSTVFAVSHVHANYVVRSLDHVQTLGAQGCFNGLGFAYPGSKDKEEPA